MNFRIVGLGEVLWDMLPSGPQLGGAPANFACHAQALGARASVISRIGKDDLGCAALRRFEERGVGGDLAQVDDEAPTGTVTVELAGDGIPTYLIHENVAWDNLAVTPAALKAVAEADAICFGTLAQRREPSRATIQTLAAAAPAKALRVFDVNLRQTYFSREVIEQSFRVSNVIKLNDAELPIMAEMLGLGGSIRDQIESLAGKYNLQLVALTRGPAGSLLFQAGRWSDLPAVPTEIVDTIGAGDAFTAAMALGLLQKMEPDDINRLAGEVAGYVCSRPGATPPLPSRFRSRLQGL